MAVTEVELERDDELVRQGAETVQRGAGHAVVRGKCEQHMGGADLGGAVVLSEVAGGGDAQAQAGHETFSAADVDAVDDRPSPPAWSHRQAR